MSCIESMLICLVGLIFLLWTTRNSWDRNLPVNDFEDNFRNTKIIARSMKDLALGFQSMKWKRRPGLTVVLLSQLSRAAYQSAYQAIYRAKKKGPERYQNIYNVTAFAESTEIERAVRYLHYTLF